jgi:signal transduction histidine kinase
LSVKQKIVLSLWLITFVLLAAAGTLASVWFAQDQSNRLDEFLTREVRGIKDTVETYFSVNGGESPAVDSVTTPEFRFFLGDFLITRLNRPVPYKTTMGIYDPQGNQIGASNAALSLVSDDPAPPADLVLVTIHRRSDYRMASVPIVHNGKTLGSIRIACLTVTLIQVWESFVFSLLIVLTMAFLSFGLVGTFLIRWALRPVRQMSLSAGEISESHLDMRLAVPPGNDEVAQMARTLNRLLERLQSDFQFEEALLGQLGHELRTPLAILRGRNEVAIQKLGHRAQTVQAVLEDNIADIDTLVSLLNTLLSLARLDARINPVDLRPCNLAELLADLTEELSPLWEEKSLSFGLHLPGGAPTWESCLPLMVLADPILLRQVFLNLLTNAFKYTPQGARIEIVVTPAGTQTDPEWALVFQNPGPPLPEESLELVFKRFYRVDVHDFGGADQRSALGQKGFGLGLSIVKTLVDLHGGRVRAFNPPEGGAAFEVCLPRRSVPVGASDRKRRVP